MEQEIYIKIMVYLMGFIGSLLLFSGGIVAYVFKRHVRENDKAFDQNREDHRDIYNQLRGKADKKR